MEPALTAEQEADLDRGETVRLRDTDWACTSCRADVYLRKVDDCLDCRIAHDPDCESHQRIRAFESAVIAAFNARNN